MNDDNIEEKRKEFIKELKNLEEVKYIKKMNITNVITVWLTILIIPLVFLAGYFLNIIILEIMAIIYLVILLSYITINSYKCKDIILKLLIKKITDFFNSKYESLESEEKIKDDFCEMLNIKSDEEIDFNHLARFNKNGEQTDLFTCMETRYTRSGTHEICHIILAKEFKQNGVLHLGNNYKYDIFKKNREIFEKCFWIDKNINKKNNEYYIQLSECQKQDLIKIFNKYPIYFTIKIIDGYLFIESQISNLSDYIVLKKIFDIQNCLDEVLTALIA